jgi:energy-coupling factor transport system ATP-binding protein
VLALRDISFTYAPRTPYAQPALHGVSLQVARGSLTLVVGASGSGKSTLLRVASGLVPPTGGGAEIEGAPLAPASARGRVALLFQNPESQLFAETVLRDVAFGPRNLGHDEPGAEQAAREALEMVCLSPGEYAERSPFALSGGEARRVALAGVLAMRPDYLLLDEPTAGLDARGRAAVRAIVASMRTRAGVVIVTHDPEEFLAEADRVVVLADGREAFSGSTADLLHDPAVLDGAGLALPPLLAVQAEARRRGCLAPVGAPTSLDPREVADMLLAARGA